MNYELIALENTLEELKAGFLSNRQINNIIYNMEDEIPELENVNSKYYQICTDLLNVSKQIIKGRVY